MKRKGIDLAAAFICLAVFGISWLYPDQVRYQGIIQWIAGILTVCFFILAIRDKGEKYEMAGGSPIDLPSESELITEVVLLSEEDTELMVWDIYGKTAMVIGRDVKENQVDIDLSQGAYASMVDVEHAVLNYSLGNWYVEDLGSSNGISVKKAEDGKIYKLSADTPCRLGQGDCLYVGLNRLLLR